MSSMAAISLIKERRRISIIVLLLLLLVDGAYSSQYTVENNCQQSVWIETDPSMDLIIFEVPPEQILITNADDDWRGRLWLRTRCATDATGNFSCLTGNCDSGTESCQGRPPAPPFTALEVASITGHTSLDYAVGLEHGFNVPATVRPENGSATCRPSGCAEDINKLCPGDLQVRGPDGVVVGCKSDCDATGDPKDCCDREYGGREECQPSASASLFKKACPSAHTWKYDPWELECGGSSFYMVVCP